MNIKHKIFAAGVSALSIMAGSASAQDLIVDGSLCVGFDCVAGESFGFDTIRLKENNLRIKAQDTSIAASFPSRDWQITFNDSSNGGANKFAIDDIDGGRTPLTIIAGARTNAVFVDSQGDVGFGTGAPAVTLHAVEGDSPTLRLEQDGSSGFQAQTWDLAGNETNFFVRDVTNGSRLPLRIRPGAPTSSIDIAADGDVGIGESSPDGALHIKRSSGTNVDIVMEEVSGTTWTLRNNEATGRMTWTNGATTPFKMGPTAVENLFRVGITANNEVDINGNLIIDGTVTTTGPTCAAGCDAVFGADYELPTIGDHFAKTTELGYLPNVGPTLPGVPVNLAEKMGGILNELEHAHIFIAELNGRISQLESQLADR
ncbi:MAG: hypothetical protein ACSHWS_10215 [Sulfitobacter sp.]